MKIKKKNFSPYKEGGPMTLFPSINMSKAVITKQFVEEEQKILSICVKFTPLTLLQLQKAKFNFKEDNFFFKYTYFSFETALVI